jgi:CBS domain-containing protein
LSLALDIILLTLSFKGALDAFKTIQMNNISGLAIVDDDGAIVDNLSVSDLKVRKLACTSNFA